MPLGRRARSLARALARAGAKPAASAGSRTFVRRAGFQAAQEYAVPMSTPRQENADRPSLLKKAVAALILIVVVVVLAKVLLSFLAGILWLVIAVVVIGALLWALNTLL
jgi:hypothetical protein